MGTNGYLTFVEGDDNYWPNDPTVHDDLVGDSRNPAPPRIAPLWTDLSLGSNGQIYVEDNSAYFRVSWDRNVYFWDRSKSASASVTLYNTNNWIVFCYGDVDSTTTQPTLVGLSPGSGTVEGHPGFPDASTPASPSEDFNSGGTYTYLKYQAIYEYFDEHNSFDLNNSYLIFKPGSPKYSLTIGSRDMFVDHASLDTAILGMVENSDIVAAAENGDFLPGDFISGWSGYTYGLQTVGQDAGEPKLFLNSETFSRINNDGFLAYIVQVEEDRLNQKILDMHGDAAGASLRNTIFSALETGTIRQRDDLLMRIADAQAGRVLRDQNGNWVRTQQYILRPDEQTVQILNVSLRGESGPLSGLSTIDARTTFTSALDPSVSLKTLPWGSWMNTRIDNTIGKYVLTTPDAPGLDSMSVRFGNPASESLKEARFFDDRTSLNDGNGEIFDYHPISSETLTLNDVETFTFSDNPVNGQYAITQNTGDGMNPAGFSYMVRSNGTVTNIPVAFFVLGDGDMPENRGVMPGYGDQDFQDIWDAIRVNETGASNIGTNNLEIAIDKDAQYFSRPIDVVYVPMSRMLWRRK